MKTKNIIALFSILLLIILIILFVIPETKPYKDLIENRVGRYQIVNGGYTFLSSSGRIEIKTAFRIDTKTGKAWYFRNAFTDNKRFEDWIEINENPTMGKEKNHEPY